MRTFLVIKPDAVAKRAVGRIISRLEDEGFELVRMEMKRLRREQAERFYEVHRGKDFYPSLVEFIISGPVVGVVLEAPDAIGRLRKLVGNTNPAQAEKGTLRELFGTDTRRNAVHASDSPGAVDHEVEVFFS